MSAVREQASRVEATLQLGFGVSVANLSVILILVLGSLVLCDLSVSEPFPDCSKGGKAYSTAVRR